MKILVIIFLGLLQAFFYWLPGFGALKIFILQRVFEKYPKSEIPIAIFVYCLIAAWVLLILFDKL